MKQILLCMFVVVIPHQAFAQKPPPGFNKKAYRIWNCERDPTVPAKRSSRLQADEVFKIAIVAAQDEHMDLQRFETPTACFSSSMNEPYWVVFFEGIDPLPGNHFGVQVDDKTKQARFFAGE